jgi:hypothetical protein
MNNLQKLIRRIFEAKDFYTLLEIKPWGINCRIFTSRYGAVREALQPGWESEDLIASYPYVVTSKIAYN